MKSEEIAFVRCKYYNVIDNFNQRTMAVAKTALVQARMEPELKEKADKVFAALGLNASTAISLFYAQTVRQGGIPLELKVPNEETMEAIEELNDPEKRKNLCLLYTSPSPRDA